MTTAAEPATPAPIPAPEHTEPGPLLLAEPTRSALHRRVEREIARLTRAATFPHWDTDAVTAAVGAQVDRVAMEVVRGVFALELNLARMAGRLYGDTAQDRYAAFVAQLRSPAARNDLLGKYPSLTVSLRRACVGQAEAMLELLTRLSRDWPQLRATFHGADEAGPLVGLDCAGDPHRGGRSVTILRFAHGWQVVYKPRSLAPEQHYQQLLRWTEDQGWSPSFRRVSMVLRNEYGWVEHVDPAGCRSTVEVRRFYRRIGGQLALLHILSAADMHQENLVAAGEHPVLVDLEALFQAPLAGLGHGADPLSRSVLQVGLLPTCAGARPAGGAVGAAERERDAALDWAWQQPGTDAMRLVRATATRRPDHHRPTLASRSVDYRAHRVDLLAGFEDMYRLLAEHRDQLLAGDGPISAFRDDTVRVIIRPTSVYGRLIEASRHPDAVCSVDGPAVALARVRRLLRTAPELTDLVTAEESDLAHGDIPLFTAGVSSRDVGAGPAHLSPAVLVRSGLAVARGRITALGEDDLARARWAIRAAFALDHRQMVRTHLRTAPAGTVGSSEGLRRRLLTEANRIGDRLMCLSYADGDSLGWLGVQVHDDGVRMEGLGPQLYDGTLGVCFFLMYLGVAGGRPRVLGRALRSVESTARRLLDGDAVLTGIGAFTGWGGVVYVLAHAGGLAQPGESDRWRHLLRDALERLDDQVATDTDFDVIGGAAGAILALTCVSDPGVRDRAVAVAVRAGDHLLAGATRSAQGLGWIGRGQTVPLSGFAHGAAGIALALDRLARVTGHPRFRDAARSALAYEGTLFCPSSGNWLDLRPDRAAGTTAWCHGAPGIGLSRIHLRGAAADQAIRAEIRTAIATTVARPGPGRSLCHGFAGNIDVLIEASRHLPRTVTKPELDDHSAALLARSRLTSDRDGFDAELDSPALMTGLSGIGYQFLRLRDPDRLPCLLALAPPVARPTRSPA